MVTAARVHVRTFCSRRGTNVLFAPFEHARRAGWEPWSGGELRAKQPIRRLCNTPVHCASSLTLRHLSSPCEHACTVPSRTSLPRKHSTANTMSSTCHTFSSQSRFPAAGWPRPIKEEDKRWRHPLRPTKATPPLLPYKAIESSLERSSSPLLR